MYGGEVSSGEFHWPSVMLFAPPPASDWVLYEVTMSAGASGGNMRYASSESP